jgi:hypothetical protein
VAIPLSHAYISPAEPDRKPLLTKHIGISDPTHKGELRPNGSATTAFAWATLPRRIRRRPPRGIRRIRRHAGAPEPRPARQHHNQPASTRRSPNATRRSPQAAYTTTPCPTRPQDQPDTPHSVTSTTRITPAPHQLNSPHLFVRCRSPILRISPNRADRLSRLSPLICN